MGLVHPCLRRCDIFVSEPTLAPGTKEIPGMGCAGGSARKDQLEFTSTRPIVDGGDKEIFSGLYCQKPIVIAVSKRSHTKRLLDEIAVFQRLGKHKNIIEMLCQGKRPNGQVYIGLERVEPIGYDLDRLVNQHAFAKRSVPAMLTMHIIRQLNAGLAYMHGRGFIHRDLKLQNVLVTSDFVAKIIDMGITCSVGTKEKRWVKQKMCYLAPELCEAKQQTAAVDCWGVGLILHQIYQHRWDLVDASEVAVRFRPGRPRLKEPMAENLKEAMVNLLELDVAKRWTLAKLSEKVLTQVDVHPGSQPDDWPKPTAQTDSENKYFGRYLSGQPPPTAYALHVTTKSTPRLINQSVRELGFRSKYGATIVLIDNPSQSDSGENFIFPGPNSIIKSNMWLYFGLPYNDNMEKAADDIKTFFFPNDKEDKNTVNDQAGLMPFTLEFDAFEFPKHIGQEKQIGPGETEKALDLRAVFKINLSGILRKGMKEPVWFPGPLDTVSAGDYGLIVRSPHRDGSTVSTVTDDRMKGLMVEKLYSQNIKNVKPKPRESNQVESSNGDDKTWATKPEDAK